MSNTNGATNGNKVLKLDEVDEETLNSGAEGYVSRRLYGAAVNLGNKQVQTLISISFSKLKLSGHKMPFGWLAGSRRRRSLFATQPASRTRTMI